MHFHLKNDAAGPLVVVQTKGSNVPFSGKHGACIHGEGTLVICHSFGWCYNISLIVTNGIPSKN